MSKNKLYTLLMLACSAGYAWLWYATLHQTSGLEVCLFKHATDIPCPSCGSTRAIIALLNGHFYEALLLNPLGFVVLMVMIICPAWIGIDLLRKRNTLANFYFQFEMLFRKKAVALSAIFLILINWVWNIYKGV
ncbi:MAG TPA: DUF2752 domain-containing protein [Cyclobacteriaceae bacterium]|nr:DUF2752 domain-containing protein [Cyclobacteriaceae bacterium]